MRYTLSQCKLVAFDVTGTLLKLRYSPGLIYERVARQEFGYRLKVASLDQGFRKNFKILSKEIPNYGDNWRDWWSLLVQRTLKDADVSTRIEEQHLPILSEKLIAMYETKECWESTEGAIEFVRHFKQLGLRTGIITNSDPRIKLILRDLDFPTFDFVLSSFDAGCMKPDPKIFQMALDICGAPGICASQAMYVGNDLKLDYEAAYKSNWTGILINDKLLADGDLPEDLKFKSISSCLKHFM